MKLFCSRSLKFLTLALMAAGLASCATKQHVEPKAGLYKEYDAKVNATTATSEGTWSSPMRSFTGVMGAMGRAPKTEKGQAAVKAANPNISSQADCIPIGEPVVESTASLVVWETLEAIYASLGFDHIADNAFKALVLARIIEPTSKADTVRVLAELGVPGPTRVTFMRCLKRVIERDYRTVIAASNLPLHDR